MNWRNSFKEGKELIVSTCSKDGKPNANIVISKGFKDGKLLFADCQMKTTIKNLKSNKRVCIVGGYYRIKGTVEVLNKGKYFDECDVNKKYPVKNIMVTTVKEVFDFDNVRVISRF